MNETSNDTAFCQEDERNQNAQHIGLYASALAAVPHLYAAGGCADNRVPLSSNGRHSDCLHGVQSNPWHPGKRMGGVRPLYSIPFIAGLYAVLIEHLEIKCVRTSLGISRSNPAGILAEPDHEQRHQAEDSACSVHAEFYLCDCSLRYCPDPAFSHRHAEYASGNILQFHDHARGLPYDLHCQRHLAGSRLGFHYLHGGTVQCQQGTEGSCRSGWRKYHPADQSRGMACNQRHRSDSVHYERG